VRGRADLAPERLAFLDAHDQERLERTVHFSDVIMNDRDREDAHRGALPEPPVGFDGVKRVLVAYATREGQTQKVADHVAATLRARGLDVDVVNVKTPPPTLDVASYAHVILAASLHVGTHEREMVDFARANRTTLDSLPTSLLSLSMSEAGAEDATRTDEQRKKAASNVKETIDRFLQDTGLHPGRVMPVAGALKYLEYGWLIRFVMKRISKAEGGPTDTSRDYEMTDWVALDRFGEEVAASLGAASG
jgi:menaquinone-dependent protoporphyrinogen oxidase